MRSTKLHRVHVLAHANPATKDVARLGLRSADEVLASIREHAADGSPALRITGTPALWETEEDEQRGGRRDDSARVRDIQHALDDPRTLAIVALSGGAYFSRIVPELRFDALAQRQTPLWAFGFSEMTTLVNAVATHRMGRGVYWLCPSYLAWKIKPRAAGRAAFGRFWRQLPAILAALDSRAAPSRADASLSLASVVPLLAHTARRPPGIGRQRTSVALRRAKVAPRPTLFERAELTAIRGTLAIGRFAPRTPATARIVGGCLSVLAGLAGAPRRLRPKVTRAWLVIEDVNEAPYRIDRFLAALKIAGWFERVAGVLVGDFHTPDQPDQQSSVLELLRFHLPRDRQVPVVTTRDVGHVWPMSPVLLNRPLRLVRHGRQVEFCIGP